MLFRHHKKGAAPHINVVVGLNGATHSENSFEIVLVSCCLKIVRMSGCLHRIAVSMHGCIINNFFDSKICRFLHLVYLFLYHTFIQPLQLTIIRTIKCDLSGPVFRPAYIISYMNAYFMFYYHDNLHHINLQLKLLLKLFPGIMCACEFSGVPNFQV